MSEPARALNVVSGSDAPAAAPQPVGVVDIGSNTVRLVVYDGASRAPLAMFNESAFCGLGRDLERSDRLNPEAAGDALRSINRFSRLARGMGVRHLSLIATAAVRDAVDGGAFAEEARRICGEPVTVLSGEEEARISAMGVISAIPEADGIIGDLGGGSLELVEVHNGALRRQTTLPLGMLRLSNGHAADRSGALRRIERALGRVDWLRGGKGRTFYPVGGAWRAVARLHMAHIGHPLHVIDGYAMTAKDMRDIAELVASSSLTSLRQIPGVTRRRRDGLPLASDLMRAVLAACSARRVIFSAQGLREGFVFGRLSAAERAADPVMAAAEALAAREARFGASGRALFDWIQPLFGGRHEGCRRLRLVACHLADVGWREHPDYRAIQTFNRLLRFPFAGLGHEERAFLAFVAFVRYGGDPTATEVQPVFRLLSKQNLRRGETVGQALRLAFRVSGGAANILARSRLRVVANRLHLDLPDDGSSPVDDPVERSFDALVAASRMRRGRIGG